jgi:hypothetical protein
VIFRFDTYLNNMLLKSDNLFSFNPTLSFLSGQDEVISRKWLGQWALDNGVKTLDGKNISENEKITISRSMLHSTEPRNMAILLNVTTSDAEKLCSYLKVVITCLI